MRLRPSEEFHHDHGLVIAGYCWLLPFILFVYELYGEKHNEFNGVKSGLVKCAERIHVDLLLHTLPLV